MSHGHRHAVIKTRRVNRTSASLTSLTFIMRVPSLDNYSHTETVHRHIARHAAQTRDQEVVPSRGRAARLRIWWPVCPFKTTPKMHMLTDQSQNRRGSYLLWSPNSLLCIQLPMQRRDWLPGSFAPSPQQAFHSYPIEQSIRLASCSDDSQG